MLVVLGAGPAASPFPPDCGKGLNHGVFVSNHAGGVDGAVLEGGPLHGGNQSRPGYVGVLYGVEINGGTKRVLGPHARLRLHRTAVEPGAVVGGHGGFVVSFELFDRGHAMDAKSSIEKLLQDAYDRLGLVGAHDQPSGGSPSGVVPMADGDKA